MSQPNILLVDDVPANLFVLQTILGDLGYNLVEAHSGMEALEKLLDEEFAAILLDVYMPELDGFETAKLIRGHSRFKRTPIIFLTAHDIDRAHMEQGYMLGAVDFLIKPLVPIILQAKINGFVELFEEKRRAKREAQELRLLIDGTTEYAIYMVDPGGLVMTWNPGAERIMQYRAEEIIGQHFSRFFSEEAVERGRPAYELRMAQTDGRFEDEAWRVRKDGSQFWANVILTALYDEFGKLRGFSKITRDLAERKRAEDNARRLLVEEASRQAAEANAQVIQEQRERLRVTLASIGDAVISTDAKGRVRFMNPVAEQLTGWTQHDAKGMQLHEVFHIINGQTRETLENRVDRVLRDGSVVGLANDTVLISKDGVERPIDDSAAPIRDATGRTIGSVLVFRDITERKRTEQGLRFLADVSATLASVVDDQSTLQKIAGLAVPHFADWCTVEMIEPDGTTRQLAVVHADPAKVALAQEFQRRYPPDPASVHGVAHVLRTGKSNMMSDIPDALLIQAAKDDEHLRILRALGFRSYMCVPLKGRDKLIGVLTFVSAESERRYTNADLIFAEELARRAAIAVENTLLYTELREADRRKDEFLATLAHELRNPLAPIRNSLQILKMPNVDAAIAQQSREMIERQVHHLVRLVDDLLDVSRVMRGKIELRKEYVELASIVARAVETAQPLIEAQQHELTISLPPDSLVMFADPVRLAQVVGNLLTNAAKYTEANGRIRLTTRPEGDEVVLRVKDTGIGIAPDMLPHIFELFVQADYSATRSQGGLGIGLTLVKSLVEMHGGTIEARSEGLGKGSEFTVRLPLAMAKAGEIGEKKTAQPPHAALSTGNRILVVDDNKDAAESLAMLLRLQGHDVRVANSGAEALETAADYRPDMIFLDLGMPAMDGYEVARRIRRHPDLKNTVLAALTGWGQQEDRRRSAEAGFDHHLVKPPEPKILESVLAQLNARNR